MFTNDRRQEQRTGRSGTPRLQYLQELVTKFQNTNDDEEPNEKLVEFGLGGICNCCADPENAAIITQCGGVPLVIQCLSSPVRNTVEYAIGSLYYLCGASNKEEIFKPEVVDVMKRYAAAEAVNVSFSNLAKAFLDRLASEDNLETHKSSR